MKFTIFLIVLTLGQIIAINIECEFKFVRNISYKNFERYKCYAKSVTFENDEDKIGNIFGDRHLLNKTDGDVTMFHSDKSKFEKFPRDFNAHFPNIEMIDVYQAELKEITRADFSQFGDKLKSVWLMRNGIRKIEADLFRDNPNIEWINLSENNILHVEIGAFIGYNKLGKLFFKLNPCYDGATSDPAKLKELITKIDVECKSEVFKVQQIKSLAEGNVNLAAEINAVKSNVTALLALVNEKNKRIDEVLLQMNKSKIESQTKIGDLKKKNAELTNRLEDRNAIISNFQDQMLVVKADLISACIASNATYLARADGFGAV